MADGRDLKCWDDHADECRVANRKPFVFDENSDERHIWLRKTLLELRDKFGIVKCLDLGCGPGYWINLFEGLSYTGFDQSPKMLALGREISPQVNFVQGNARKLIDSFESDSFDLVFTNTVLQHNRNYPDKDEIVQGIYDILVPSGFYLGAECTFNTGNCPESEGFPYYTEGNSFTVKGWEQYMLERGFKLLEYHFPSEYLYRKI